VLSGTMLELIVARSPAGSGYRLRPRGQWAPVLILGFWDAAVWVGSGGGD
jgi:hypothetical protein